MTDTARWAWVWLIGLGCQACYGATERDRPRASAGATGSGGSASSGGSAGSGDGAVAGACNAVDHINVFPDCLQPEEIPAPTGGQIADGLYALVGYATARCTFPYERTARITSMSDDTYSLELVVNIPDGRANAVFVTSGTSITSTYVCGGAPDEALEYAIEDSTDAYTLYVSGKSSTFVFQRFGD